MRQISFIQFIKKLAEKPLQMPLIVVDLEEKLIMNHTIKFH